MLECVIIISSHIIYYICFCIFKISACPHPCVSSPGAGELLPTTIVFDSGGGALSYDFVGLKYCSLLGFQHIREYSSILHYTDVCMFMTSISTSSIQCVYFSIFQLMRNFKYF